MRMHDTEPGPWQDRPAARGRQDDVTYPVQRLLALQRAAGNEAVTSALADEEQRSPVLDVVGRGGGAPLPGGLRHEMEGRLGADFSDVRVHSGGPAAASASSVQAHAYTVGHEIVLGAGREDLTSATGRHTLAHELTHVMQQRAGAVDGTPAAGGITVSDPSDRFERAAEAAATAALSGPAPAAPATGAADAAIQRETDEEPAVQRQDGEEADEEELTG